MESIAGICSLFETISEYTWTQIANNNKRGSLLDERGITTGVVISKIQDFIEKSGTKNLFAQKAKNESKRGGDLEIYLEHSDNEYIRFFLQAKILKPDGTYHDINHKVKNTNEFQWDLIEEYSREAQCIPAYLFYNGIADYKYKGSDCKGKFDEKQYGCSITEVSEVKKYCNTNGRLPFNPNTTQQPIGRCIPCCFEKWDVEIESNNIKLYTQDEIDMDPSFDKIFRVPRIGFRTTDMLKKTEVEEVNEELSDKGWAPVCRIVVSSSGIYPGTTKLIFCD